MDTVNLAIDRVLSNKTSISDGQSVSVSVAPSMISVFSSAVRVFLRCTYSKCFLYILVIYFSG
jgi:hypothetical protein